MYEKALVFNPNLWQSHGSLAGIYYNKKEYQKALIHIEAALKIVPDNQMLLQAREQLKKMLK
jgi:tetratricopeptide (TPR) repeat protein